MTYVSRVLILLIIFLNNGFCENATQNILDLDYDPFKCFDVASVNSTTLDVRWCLKFDDNETALNMTLQYYIHNNQSLDLENSIILPYNSSSFLLFDLRPGTKYGIKLLVTSTTNKKYSSHTITQMTEEINVSNGTVNCTNANCSGSDSSITSAIQSNRTGLVAGICILFIIASGIICLIVIIRRRARLRSKKENIWSVATTRDDIHFAELMEPTAMSKFEGRLLLDMVNLTSTYQTGNVWKNSNGNNLKT